MLGGLFKCVVQAGLDGNHYVGQAGFELTGICFLGMGITRISHYIQQNS